MPSFQVTLHKYAKRSLQDNVIKSNLSTIIAATNSKSLTVRGWTVAPDPRPNQWGTQMVDHLQLPAEDETDGEYAYRYELFCLVTFDKATETPANELAAFLRKLNEKASAHPNGRWNISHVNGKEYAPPSDDSDMIEGADNLVGYVDVEIPEDWDDYFSHLFGLDHQIARIKSSIQAGLDSDWDNRFNIALIGPPGCGKSDICRSVKAALGGDAAMEYDATATTAAGMQKDLTEREILPRVLIVEEIEKADEKALQPLMSMLDLRGEIRKVTARQNVQQNTRLFTICTVNDYNTFQHMLKDALASRFTHHVFFRRPERDMLARILDREVRKVRNGDPAWIEATLDFCDEMGISDPRSVIAHMLSGRDQLLDGSYQEMVRATSQAFVETDNAEELTSPF